ncbi:MAG: molecular chaperone HtpG [Gammaproteobacteria bacterium]|nr:MAG: molecular chaperone HtpG [Gammaproteobacteria bacterium]
MSKPIKKQFETEVSQILKLVIHSLYSNQEIFLRELISNASDACDRLRFLALENEKLYEGDKELQINICFDESKKTITIRDNGIGMSEDEVVENIGTIAKSGTKQFLEALSGDNKKDAHLIGQFGVGFYSAFIVADKVTLTTRKAGDKKENGVVWVSDGATGYTITTTKLDKHGTEITIHLKDESKDFASQWRIQEIIKKYSDHITFPIKMQVEKPGEKEGESTIEDETINNTKALWAIAKKDIKDEEYKEFYKHLSRDFAEPLDWIHNKVEGKFEWTSLFYIPSKAPFDMWDRDHMHGIKLFVKRVFIMDDAKQILPRYLRFVKGLVDSDDLPLNVSREILQSNKIIDAISKASVKKILGWLDSIAKKDKKQYQTIWQEFGAVLKEGAVEDFANQEQIMGLYRFASTIDNKAEQNTSLDDYISKIDKKQDKIYYITADSFNTAKNSPHLEMMRTKNIPVLLMFDKVDEWMMSYLQEYKGKKLINVAKGELDLYNSKDKKDDKKDNKTDDKKTNLPILDKFKKALGDKVEGVIESKRLTSSPACLSFKTEQMALHMQQMMKQAGHAVPEQKPTLELNMEHNIIKRLIQEKDENKIKEWALLLLDQSVLSEGGQLEDPTGFVKRLNKMLVS